MDNNFGNIFYGYNAVDFYVLAERDGCVIFANELLRGRAAKTIVGLALSDMEEGEAETYVRRAQSAKRNLLGQSCTFLGEKCTINVMPGEVTLITLVPERGERDDNENKLLYNLALTFSDSLRGPLSGICQSADMLKGLVEKVGEVSGAEDARRYLAMLDKSFFQLYLLTDNANGLVNLSENPNTLEFTAGDIIKVCERAIKKAEIVYDILKIPLTFDSDYQSLLFLFDESAVERVLLNLLSNSAAYTRDGNSVSVKVTATRSHCYITVADKGRGIAAEKMSEIMTASPESIIARGGLHSGLIIVKKLVSLHDGSFVVETGENEGTTVTVSLSRENNRALRIRQSVTKYEMSGGFPRVLIEMAGALNSEQFARLQKRLGEMEHE